MGRGSKSSADGVKKRCFCRGRKRPKTVDQAPSKLSTGVDSSASSLANIQPPSEPVPEQEPSQGQDTALVEQLKALMKQNEDLAALLKESKRKLDVMTKNAEKAKKNYVSEKKANKRKYEEMNEFRGSLKVQLDATRQAVADLNAAMHFVLERGHEGKFFHKLWSQTREWKIY
ncbi:hypothetical protein QR685DRAFT_236999 [Neurospora intermedia]|uniref:Uncharacterized protein n=1 Tax=Neurospora intermedia TaxID=5142 RepID=A0ABR3DIF9_NEUIN